MSVWDVQSVSSLEGMLSVCDVGLGQALGRKPIHGHQTASPARLQEYRSTPKPSELSNRANEQNVARKIRLFLGSACRYEEFLTNAALRRYTLTHNRTVCLMNQG